jgi:hypothetical protein
MIKITQFSSSIVINDEKLFQSDGKKSSNYSKSISPQKSFTIKKVNELNKKVTNSVQKIVDLEMKKK